ncbi:MAG: hypothetical protein PUJ21_03705, partial [Clostridia bacterium]|nr:hypothetical protein [Clostridia bacterium]
CLLLLTVGRELAPAGKCEFESCISVRLQNGKAFGTTYIVFQRQGGGSKPPPYNKERSHFAARRNFTFRETENFTSPHDETSLSVKRKNSPYGGSKPPPYDEVLSWFLSEGGIKNTYA